MFSRHRLVMCALLAVSLASLASAWLAREGGPPADALSGADVAFSPASSALVLGATPVPTVDVTVANASGVAGYEAWVSVGGSAAHLTGLSDAGFLENPNPSGTPQNTVVCTTPTVTATYGYLACSVLALPPPFPPPVPPSAGATPAPLVHASFSAAAAGTSALSLTAVADATPETTLLFDVNNTPIPATLGGGSITVSAPASVGGVARMPDIATLPAQRDSRSGRGLPVYGAIAAGLLVAAFVVIGATRRRRRTSR